MAVGHVGHPRLLHHRVDAALDVVAHAFDLGDEGQVLAHGHVRIERRRFRQVAGAPLGFERLLEHVEAGDGGLALGGRHVAGDDAHRGGLAGAVGAEKSEDFARLGAKTHIVDGRDRAVMLGKVLNLDHERSPKMENGVSSTAALRRKPNGYVN